MIHFGLSWAHPGRRIRTVCTHTPELFARRISYQDIYIHTSALITSCIPEPPTMLQSKSLSRLLTQSLSQSLLLVPSATTSASPLAISLITNEGELICSYFSPSAPPSPSVSPSEITTLLKDDLKIYAIFVMDAFKKQELTEFMELDIDSYTLLLRRISQDGLFTLMVIAKDFPKGFAITKLEKLNTVLKEGLKGFQW
ncbi:hypothetical protein BABINDRAFT_160360 [Babjeviella inositovora NRRL Y-12698]|uniref:Uncharacterized protein n=1 Tax=Babjeviella inositovora NRRL Y-12698 TaxID=984486 RepID=A0A1E3QV43_9ASCO|nr:uncharacterized protein BABINDRAFT_160360 [Babjeviella inositovora NRRL Y-12698]ODQ80922.1 hypothetical protein BABINDRAFT_160360 [Babjeviella inositovora NRRL Y-12698]